MAMKLNESALIEEVMESVPVKDGIFAKIVFFILFYFIFLVELIISSLSEQYVQRLLVIISSAIDSSRHLEFYLIWAQTLLTIHGPKIAPHKNMAYLLALEKSLVRKHNQISKM